MQIRIVRGVEGDAQQAVLLGAGKSGVEIIEIQGFQVRAAAQDGMLQLAADVGREQARAGNSGTHRIAKAARDRAVGSQHTLVEDVSAIAGVAGEQLIAAFAGENHFHVLRG